MQSGGLLVIGGNHTEARWSFVKLWDYFIDQKLVAKKLFCWLGVSKSQIIFCFHMYQLVGKKFFSFLFHSWQDNFIKHNYSHFRVTSNLWRVISHFPKWNQFLGMRAEALYCLSFGYCNCMVEAKNAHYFRAESEGLASA